MMACVLILLEVSTSVKSLISTKYILRNKQLISEVGAQIELFGVMAEIY